MALVVEFNEERVHELYPEASMVPAMEIWQLPKTKKSKLEECCNSGEYLASVKKDGYFYMLNKTGQFCYLFSRNPGVNGFLTEKIGNVPHIAEAAASLPPDTLLVGEIHIPGKTSKGVTRIMGCLPAKAIERQKDEGYVRYYLNDIVMLDGEDLREKPFEERAEILTKVYNDYLATCEFIDVAEQISENIFETAAELIANGEEGMVLKKKDALYTCGKRPAWSSIKVKQEDTVDVIITGFGDPTKLYTGTSDLESWPYWTIEDGKEIAVTKHWYNGWKNRLDISAYNDDGELQKIGTVSSGLTDELRAEFANNPEQYLNKVIEVRCMSVDSKEHTIRHGFFLRFRDDKNPESCTFKNIF